MSDTSSQSEETIEHRSAEALDLMEFAITGLVRRLGPKDPEVMKVMEAAKAIKYELELVVSEVFDLEERLDNEGLYRRAAEGAAKALVREWDLERAAQVARPVIEEEVTRQPIEFLDSSITETLLGAQEDMHDIEDIRKTVEETMRGGEREEGHVVANEEEEGNEYYSYYEIRIGAHGLNNEYYEQCLTELYGDTTRKPNPLPCDDRLIVVREPLYDTPQYQTMFDTFVGLGKEIGAAKSKRHNVIVFHAFTLMNQYLAKEDEIKFYEVVNMFRAWIDANMLDVVEHRRPTVILQPRNNPAVVTNAELNNLDDLDKIKPRKESQSREHQPAAQDDDWTMHLSKELDTREGETQSRKRRSDNADDPDYQSPSKKRAISKKQAKSKKQASPRRQTTPRKKATTNGRAPGSARESSLIVVLKTQSDLSWFDAGDSFQGSRHETFVSA